MFNILTFDIKLNYQKSSEFLEEINYGLNYNYMKNDEEFPIVYYIKDINNKGIDINLYFSNNNNNFTITGYIVDLKDIQTLQETGDKNKIDLSYPITGKYDYDSQSGLISFNIEEFGKNKYKDKDIYYGIEIEQVHREKFSDFNIQIFANPKSQPKYFLIKNKYIRGSFNLSIINNNKNQNTHTYFIQNEDDENNTIIFEFSSNYNDIDISFNCTSFINKGKFGYVKIYNISSVNNIQIEIKIKNIEGIDLSNESLKEVNYLMKYYYINNKDEDIYNFHFLDIKAELNPKGRNEYFSNYNIKFIKSNEIDDFNYTNKSFSYYLSLYQKDNVFKNELLNTISIISSKNFFFKENKDANPNDEISFDINDLANNEYIGVLFIKIIGLEDNELYKAVSFNISKYEIENQKNYIIIILTVIIIFILILLFIFYFSRRNYKKKNKNLQEQVQAITFSSGISNSMSSLDPSKDDDDEENYETTYV